MLIASKYEEMYPPEVRDFVFIADNAYSRSEIFAMEALILRKLDFNLGTPLPLHFLRRFSRACHADTQVHTLAKYLMELKTMSYGMVKFRPSETAAASIWIARKVCDASATWVGLVLMLLVVCAVFCCVFHWLGWQSFSLSNDADTHHGALQRLQRDGHRALHCRPAS